MGDETQKLVLIVDDTPDNIDVLSGVLGGEYKIKVALNGARALTIAKAEPHPDLILLDVMMPDMDGFEVCRQLKEHAATAEIPIIFVTARTATDDETKGFEVGGSDYITKPIKPDVVRARVRTHLELNAARRETERLLTDNREMLDKTLVGSMRVVADLLSWANPDAFLRAARLRSFMEGMVRELRIKGGWQLNLAATLSQIGLVALPTREMNNYVTGQGVTLKFLTLFKKQSEIGSRSLEQVPRLRTVARIIESQHTPLPGPGEYPKELHRRGLYLLGCQILQLLIEFDHKLLGKKSSTVLSELRQDSKHDPQLVTILQRVVNAMEWIPCALAAHKLMPGMVLEEQILFPGSQEKLIKGTVLTPEKIGMIISGFDQEGLLRLFRIRIPFKVDKDGNLPSMMALHTSTPASEPAPEKPVISRQIDPTVVEPLVRELFALLKEDDPGAKATATRLGEAVDGTAVVELVERIQQLVSVYDFPEALGVIHELAASVKVDLTQQ
ncbi:MAG: response regulator [Magnetococcales bacterium]|nr:response regulator [Magnetococcales bacterium]